MSQITSSHRILLAILNRPTNKKLLFLFLTIISLNCQAQKVDKYNLGVEKQNIEKLLSDGWFEWGNYKLTIESLTHSGKKSGKITSNNEDNSFGSMAYCIPANYKGNMIRFEGYMKIGNVMQIWASTY